jgi:hypothetical protein
MIIIKNNKYHNGTLVFVRAKELAKARSNKVVGGKSIVRIFSPHFLSLPLPGNRSL